MLLAGLAVGGLAEQGRPHVSAEPARVRAARRFLARRGLVGRRARANAGPPFGYAQGRLSAALRSAQDDSISSSALERKAGAWDYAGEADLLAGMTARRARAGARPEASGGGPVWTAVGPTAVNSLTFGLVSGRIAAVAFDPADATGNHVYLGTTGGGVWKSQNAAASVSSGVVFQPLTDGIGALSGVAQAGISVGAVSVQPGGTGVVLAGLGDPNDALDSYYGAGLLRSADGGNTWTLIEHSVDLESGLSTQDYWFVGEGFAGFAWSTTNVQLVVAAVSQAYEGTLVNAGETAASYEGLYYSQDGGVSWHLSRIVDQSGQDVQGPGDGFALPDGNAATAVVWNPVRQVFVAAVRYHGYYTSPDGVTWTQLPFYPGGQPGVGFTAGDCPTEAGSVGEAGCPIFRGALAVNPLTGDTFAWSVDEFNQDQGIWQDRCGIANGSCANQTIAFGTQLNTAALESPDENGAATIANGDYNLALAAVPAGLAQGEDTLLFAGENDLWKCSLANSCVWRDTTNATTCASAQVGEYQHAMAWAGGNPELLLVGNDSGLWRSVDQVGETGPVCAATDAGHFQNMNGSVAGSGSLAEIESLAQSKSTAATLLAGLGANGFAGVVGAPAVAGKWNEVLSGEGGPVAINPASGVNNWFASNGAGVAIEACSSTTACTASGFAAAVGEAQVEDDGLTMPDPAAFVLDAEDPTQMVVGTCRVWRGPVTGVGWSAANAISPVFDGTNAPVGNDCDGDSLIGTLAVAKVSGGAAAGGEVIYAAMAGAGNGGGVVSGHVFAATVSGAGVVGSWNDLTYSPVTDDGLTFNAFGEAVSSLYVDPHDATGMTVYATISGFANAAQPSQEVYRSVDGGAHWTAITGNLPVAPANAVVVDTQDANTVYVALDTGVYVTRTVATCGTSTAGVSTGGGACWASYGSGLPESPVTTLLVDPPGAAGPDAGQALTAGTYGRGIWQIPLVTAGAALTSIAFSPGSLVFGGQTLGTVSGSETLLVKNTGGAGLTVSAVVFGGAAPLDFGETDTCVGVVVAHNGTCLITVSFTPTAAGSRVATLDLSLNITGGQLVIPVSGTGLTVGSVTLLPTSLAFGTVQVGTNSGTQGISVQNVGGSTVGLSSEVVTAPFVKGTSTCGSQLGAGSACAVNVSYSPTVAGVAAGTFTVTSSVGVVSAALSGTGILGPTDTLSATSLQFPPTVLGASATPLAVKITNSGGLPLTGIGTSITVSTGGGSDFTAVNSCGSQLAAGASCAVTVGFAPSVAKNESGTLTISDALRAQTVSLFGTGLKPPAIGLNPSASINFGNVQVNTPSVAHTVTITNTGGAPLATPGFSISGAGAANFSVTNSSGPTACGASVAAGANCVLNVVFEPSYTGVSTGILTVTSSSPGVVAASVTLTGTGLLPPIIELLPPTLVFGPVLLGNSSALFSVQVVNAGQEPMNLPTFAVSGPQAGDFALSAPTDIAGCTGNLNPGSLCTIQVTFSPSMVGAESATMTVTATNAVPMTATVSMAGVGMPVISLQANPGSLSYPLTPVGLTSTPLTVAISNLGKKTGNNLTATVTGPYQLVPASTTCGAVLKGGAFCLVSIDFSPVVAGDEPGLLTMTVTNAGVAPLVVPLDGTGLAVGGIAPSPTQMTFGSVGVETTSVAQTLTVTNSGQAAVRGLAIEVNGDFGLIGDQCPAVLAAPVCSGGGCVASSCTTGVVFTPTTTGSRQGTLTISSSSAGVAPAVVALTGSGSPPGSLSVSPAVVSFGALTVGQMSAAQTVTVTNATGPGALTLQGLAFAVSGDFSVAQNTCGMQIAIGAACSFQVSFTPTGVGTRIGSVAITSTTAGSTRVITGLTGTGLAAAQLVVTPKALQFGTVEVGTNSTAQALTVANPGSGALVGLSFEAPKPFSVGSGSCTSVLAAGASCQAAVTFTPSSGGEVSGVVTVASTSVGVTGVMVAVAGNGVLGAALTLSPRTLSFGASTIGVITAGQAVTVTNSGGLALSGLTVALTGTAVADFKVAATNCGGSLAGGSSCAALVTFEPTLAGGRTAFLTAASTTAGVASESTSLSGVGLSVAVLTTAPASHAFPPTLVGSRSATGTFTVQNAGQTGISDLVLTISSGFVIASTTCTRVLAGGAACYVQAASAPVVGGAESGELVASSAMALAEGSAPASTALSGVGALPPGIVTSLSVAIFGITGLNLSAAPIQMKVTNQGGLTALTGLSLSVNAAGTAAGFGLANSNCGSTLGPGASCLVNVTFAPKVTGNLTGSLVVASANGVGSVTGAAGSSVSVALAGTGFDFTMALVGSGSVSVVAGQTAYYTMAITPLAGSAAAPEGAFDLSCSGLPANALCVFNPPQLAALPANVSGDVTVGLGSGGPTASAALTDGERRSGAGPRLVSHRGGVLLVVGGVLPLLLWRRRRRDRRASYRLARKSGRSRTGIGISLLLLGVAGVGLVAGVSSCAGASSSGGQLHGTGTTPGGTYKVVLTASSTGIMHSITVTLVVN